MVLHLRLKRGSTTLPSTIENEFIFFFPINFIEITFQKTKTEKKKFVVAVFFSLRR
jgi:hypothetical protein